MNITIEQINVMIDSGIPDKLPFKLTSSMFHHIDLKHGNPQKLSIVPFFTKDVRYPMDKLYSLRNISYRKILKFFFDKKYFEGTIASSIRNDSDKKDKKTNTKSKKTNTKSKETNTNNKQPGEYDDAIINHNINAMMELLFPTIFPSTRNFSSSYDTYIANNQQSDISFKGISYNKFSYLKIDGKTYTVSKVTWLNDLLNNPVYKNFIDEFTSYRNWVEKESKAINALFEKKKNAIIGRLLDPIPKNTLYIFDDIQLFEVITVKDKKQIEEVNTPDNRDYEKKKFYDNLYDLISQLTDLKKDYFDTSGNIKKEDTGLGDQDKEIAVLYSKISGISELYKRLTENRTGTLKGIPASFKSRLQILLEELQTMNSLIKIKTFYITADEVNIKLGEEDPNVVKILKENYSQFIDYIEKVKLIMYPNRESTNSELQKAIVDFSENNKKDGKKLVFQELMTKIKEELIFLNSKKYFNNKENIKLMNTGISSINKNKLDEPHYEIYLGIDLFEGEINDENLESIKCKYRGLYLGQETELYFSKYNPYDFYKHRVFVPRDEKEVDPDKQGKKPEPSGKPGKPENPGKPGKKPENPGNPGKPENPGNLGKKPGKPVSGGRKTRKNKRKSIQKTKKRF